MVGVSGFLPFVLTAPWHWYRVGPGISPPAEWRAGAARCIASESYLLGRSLVRRRHGDLRGHRAVEDISYAVAVTKRFLIVFLIVGVVISIVRYQTLEDRIWGMADALVFFLVWYAYLNRSRRVANTYPRHAGSATLPTHPSRLTPD